MADKGFLIQDELAAIAATLTIPALLKGKSSLQEKQRKTKKLLA